MTTRSQFLYARAVAASRTGLLSASAAPKENTSAMTPNAKKLLIGLGVALLLSGVIFVLSRDKETPQGQLGVVGASQ